MFGVTLKLKLYFRLVYLNKTHKRHTDDQQIYGFNWCHVTKRVTYAEVAARERQNTTGPCLQWTWVLKTIKTAFTALSHLQ